MKQWREHKIERLTYKGKHKRQRFSTVDLARCTLVRLVREYGETSPRCTVHVPSPARHVGRHRRAVHLFTGIGSSSSLGACALDQTLDIGIGIGHRHLCRAGRFDGLIEIVGHVSGPPKMRVLKPAYVKSLVSERACGVYSTFGSSTSKYSLETPRPKSARISRVSYMHGT